MKKIKQYFSNWNYFRFLNLVIGVISISAYISTKENIYLVAGLFLSIKSVLNISCPGGSCTVNNIKNEGKQAMKFEEYKEKENV